MLVKTWFEAPEERHILSPVNGLTISIRHWCYKYEVHTGLRTRQSTRACLFSRSLIANGPGPLSSQPRNAGARLRLKTSSWRAISRARCDAVARLAECLRR